MCDLSQLGPNQIRIRDGEIVPFREIAPADAERLQRFHRNLSERSRYQRFMWHYPELTDAQAQRFATVDQVDRVALVAIDPLDPETLIGVVRLDRDLGTVAAEYAAVISDKWQHQGLGTELTRKLIDRAQALGIKTVYAIVLPENRPMIQLLQHLGLPYRVRYEDLFQRIELDLPVTHELEVTA